MLGLWDGREGRQSVWRLKSERDFGFVSEGVRSSADLLAFGRAAGFGGGPSGQQLSQLGRRVCSHTGCRDLGWPSGWSGSRCQVPRGLEAGEFFADKAQESNGFGGVATRGWTTDLSVEQDPEVGD